MFIFMFYSQSNYEKYFSVLLADNSEGDYTALDRSLKT